MQWMKGIWVGRLDESDGHVVLTPHGTVTGRSVRRLAGNFRVQPDLAGKIKSRVQDPALSQAELLKVLPASVPIRLSGETDTDQFAEEQDRAAQNEQIEGIEDERFRAEITRPLRSIEDDNDVEVKRQRLGAPLATIPETSDEMMEDPVPIVHEEWKRERLTKKTSRELVEMSIAAAAVQNECEHRIFVSAMSMQCRNLRQGPRRALQRVVVNTSNICWKLEL